MTNLHLLKHAFTKVSMLLLVFTLLITVTMQAQQKNEVPLQTKNQILENIKPSDIFPVLNVTKLESLLGKDQVAAIQNALTNPDDRGQNIAEDGCTITLDSTLFTYTNGDIIPGQAPGFVFQEEEIINGKPSYGVTVPFFTGTEFYQRIFWSNENKWVYYGEIRFISTGAIFYYAVLAETELDTPTPPCDGTWTDPNNPSVESGIYYFSGCCTPSCVDPDGDEVCSEDDNCPDTYNPDQTDTDGDLEGDACDTDDDNDGILDVCDSEPLVDNFIFTSVADLPASWICGNNPNNPKVLVTKSNGVTVCISPNAVQAHLNNGGMLGPNIPCGSTLQAANQDGVIPHSRIQTNLNTEFEIFPNPAKDMVNIHFNGKTTSTAQVIIYNQVGSVVWQNQVDTFDSSLQVNLSDSKFKTGVYIVSLVTETETIAQRLVITK